MNKKFTLNELAANSRDRNLKLESKALVENWSKTGLLRGLNGPRRETMARLLENQATDLLREANSISTGGGGLVSSGDLRGFSNIAFPIVRRVFGGLVANEIVSIQPMSLPSGLLFYLDYTYGNNVGGQADPTLPATAATNVYGAGQSIYGNPTGKGIRSGSLATGGQYDLVGHGYTKVHSNSGGKTVPWTTVGVFNGSTFVSGGVVTSTAQFTGSTARAAGFDADIESALTAGTLAGFTFLIFSTVDLTGSNGVTTGDVGMVDQIGLVACAANANAVAWGENYQAGSQLLNLRRLNQRGTFNGSTWVSDPLGGSHVLMALRTSGATVGALGSLAEVSMVVDSSLNVDSTDGSTLTIPSFESDFGATPSPAIPEIDIKIESIAVTATGRKLRARWTPELAQDLNAYHSLDAEVELTQILSEQVAVDIDREILGDLLREATGARYYWSRSPGKFVDYTTGVPVDKSSTLAPGPAFTGNVRDWYETLVETVVAAANTIQRKTLRGSANFIVVGPDVATILEMTVPYRPVLSIDGNGQVGAPFSMGAEKMGTLSNRFTVYKDPQFPRNKVLVGYRGSGALEAGYVYAPYVPLILTPTLWEPNDFTPRKGVMTRYGKKMVRADFYGVVTISDMNVI